MIQRNPAGWLAYVCFFAATVILPTHAAEPSQEYESQVETLDCVINPSVVADLGSGVPGILSEVRVDRSDFVAAGDVVAQLESGVEVAARDLARVRAGKDTEVQLRRVNAAFGRRQHARTEDLFRRKVISTNDMDERKTESRLASIQLRQAMDNQELAGLELDRAEQVLKRRTIKSPISGVIMERFKTIGEYVDEKPVLRVAQLDPLHVEVFVPVEKLGEIRPGMQAEVWSESIGGDGWRAQVSRVDRVADVASGTYGVRLVLPNPDYKVPAGLRCRLAFIQAPDRPLAADSAPLPVQAVPQNLSHLTGATQPPHSEHVDAVIAGTAPSEPQTPVREKAAGHAGVAGVQAAAKVTAEATEDTTMVQDADGQAAAAPAVEEPVPGEKHTALSAVPAQADASANGSQQETRTVVAEQASSVCMIAGPYEKQKTAENSARELRSTGLDVVLESYESQETRGFRVVSDWFHSRAKADALVAQLKQAGVSDYYLVPGADRRFRVALGLYSAKRIARQRVQELSAKSITAKVVPWERTRTLYALMIAGRPAPQAMKRLAGLPSLSGDGQTITASCEKIAGR